MDETATTSGQGLRLERPRPPAVPERPTLEGLEAKWSARWQEAGTYAFDRSAPRERSSPSTRRRHGLGGAPHRAHVLVHPHRHGGPLPADEGREVFYPMGFDDNGLPTERRVQQYYGVRCDPGLRRDPAFVPPEKPAKQPVAISRPDFIDLCARLAAEDERGFENLWRRSGSRSTGSTPTPPSTPRSSRPQAAQDRSSAKRITGRPDGRSDRKRSPSPESLVQNAQSSA